MSNTLKLGNGQWATGKDTILAYNDLNSNYKPLAFSFSRASSGTVVNKDGLIETVGSGEPRIDFKDNTKGALKLEPTRNNLVKSSGDISTQSTYWSSNQGGTSVQNATTSPDGSNTASQINTFGQQYGGITQGSISVSNTEYTYSIYLKAKNGTPNIRLIFFDGATFHSSDFTISSEWERYDYKFTPVAGTFQIYITCPYVETSFYTWGAQLEQGNYATSYIPTSGQANGVTRVADSCSQTLPDGVIGQTEGTLFAEFEYFGNTSGALEISPIYIGTGTYATAIYADIYQGKLYAVCFNSGVNQASINCGVLSVGTHKVAIGYSNNDIVIYLDGLLGGSETSATIPECNRVYLGTVGTSTSVQKYTQSEVKLYNTRLSNSELASLTTI